MVNGQRQNNRYGIFAMMKYKRFRWLFAAMSLALAGIICLQVYWLDKAVETERRKFADDVRTAMKDATAKLETGEAYTLISDALLPKKEGTDSLHQRDSVLTNSNGRNIRVFRKYETGKIPPDTFPVPPVPPLPPDHPQVMNMEHEIRVADSLNIVMIERSERMKNAVKGAWMQYINLSGKASERVSRKQIDEALTKSFKDAGIGGRFYFGVYDSLSGKFEFVTDSLQNKALRSSMYHVPLFPNDIRPGGSELNVLLEGENGRIFRALWPQLLMAFLLTGVLVLVFYLTFREALRQKKISDIRNDFINNMTHEFKTPIATISLATDTVTNPAIIGDAEKVRHYADVIRRENRRMNDQVEKVLELALAERNELRLEKETVSLSELLSHSVQSMSLQANAKNGKISFDEKNKLPSISADTFHLERAITNLLDNAIKYAVVPPEIKVEASLVNGNIRVEISDNGIGIAEEEQGRIFDRFYRVSTGNRHDVKGFGLGLSYVKTIVEKHGGTISVQSKPGKGSRFIVSLPV